MNKLKTNFLIMLTITIGFFAIGAFYFFYTKQKEFSYQQKEFMLALNRIEINEATLILSLLKNYIYAYSNNDEIERPLLELEASLETIQNSKILQEENYKILQKEIKKLQESFNQLFNNTQRFIMLNANIKNSLLFLSSYNNRFLRKQNDPIFIKASSIIQSLLYTKRMSDTSFLQQDLILSTKNITSKEEREFIELFNTHIKFLSKTFPIFFHVEKEIRNNPIPHIVDTIKKKFSQIALHDTKLLNQFSIILFGIFSFTYLYLIFILNKYKKEHQALEKLTQKQHSLLTTDQLTQIKNRYAFTKEHKTIQQSSVLLISIDRFKDINDVYGIETGDKLLIAVAQFLQEHATSQKEFYDLYRIGGDEFCLLFEKIQTSNLEGFANNLYQAIITHTFTINEIEINISVTIAISDKQPLLETADLALKHIKKDKNLNIITFNEKLDLHKTSLFNINMLNTIKKALQEDNVIIYFQPIINLHTKAVEKYEVLVRIQDNDTILLPYQFLDIAKKTHLYQEITRVVIEKTLQTAKEYPQYRFSINLSMSDIDNTTLTKELFFLFENNPNVASKIDIELLETEGLNDIDKVKLFIDRIHSFGSLVLIDDFGSGYSNFSYFSELDIDIVKIDGSIINEIVSNERKRHMLEAISKFCKGMELKMVAEFVDSKEIVEILEELKINYAQGYFFSPPLKKPTFTFKED